MTLGLAGAGAGGLVLPGTELSLTHTENLVLHTANTLTQSFLLADITSGEPWATDDGGGNILFAAGLYAWWLSIAYTQNALDCQFRVSIFGEANDLISLSELITVRGGTHPFVGVAGWSLFPTAQVADWALEVANAADPSFTITSLGLFATKIA